VNAQTAHRLRALILNLALSALVLGILLLCLRADSLWPFVLPGFLQYAAWPFLLAGISLIGAAEYALLIRAGATGAPGDPTGRLITTGVYGWVRNPIYLGGAAVLLGVSFARSSPTILLVSLLFAVCIHYFVVRFEEPHAERRFGKTYLEYKAGVQRWIPRSSKTH
jgi:protein-S-isoprenylcysteine O-methyltransferase Ste14